MIATTANSRRASTNTIRAVFGVFEMVSVYIKLGQTAPIVVPPVFVILNGRAPVITPVQLLELV